MLDASTPGDQIRPRSPEGIWPKRRASAAWSARYLPAAEPFMSPETSKALADGAVRVSKRGTGAFAVSIQA